MLSLPPCNELSSPSRHSRYLNAFSVVPRVARACEHGSHRSTAFGQEEGPRIQGDPGSKRGPSCMPQNAKAVATPSVVDLTGTDSQDEA